MFYASPLGMKMRKSLAWLLVLLIYGCQTAPVQVTGADSSNLPTVAGSVAPSVLVTSSPGGTRSYEDYTFIFQYPGHLNAKDLSFEQLESIAGIDFPENARGKASYINAPGGEASIFLLIIDSDSALKLTGPGALGETAQEFTFAGVQGVRTSFSTFRDGVAKHTLSSGILREKVFYQVGFLGTGSATMEDLTALEALVMSTWKWKEGATMVLPDLIDRPKLGATEPPVKSCVELLAERDSKLKELDKTYSDFLEKKRVEAEDQNRIGSAEYEATIAAIRNEKAKATSTILEQYPSECP